MTDVYSFGKPTYQNKHGVSLLSFEKGWGIVSPEDIILSKSVAGFCPTQSCNFVGPFPKGQGSLDMALVTSVLEKINDKHKKYINIIITKVIVKESPGPVCISTPEIGTEIRSDNVVEMKIQAEASPAEYLVISGDG